MLKTLFRVGLLLVIFVAVGGFLLGWWSGGAELPLSRDEVGTTGTAIAERARDASADLGERAADAAEHAKDALEDGRLTARIKSKITLDDTLEGSSIDVDTSNLVVTLTGTVLTGAQRERALQLARETTGVREVVDRLKVAR